ncbi:MAG: site-2 protease family protein [Gammaproteobacteria bacterium]|nr:site-2 protease family protein [Gammaproteobacteria bacterium]
MELTIIQKIAIWAIPILFAISLHEVAHGWVASWFGDQTARLSGRLSLNPIKHIDPIGTVLVPILMLTVSNFIFGWAKPVPVDPRNLRHPRRDMAIVALAGPISNLLMALLWGAIAKLGISFEQGGQEWIGIPLTYMGGAGVMINVVLAVLNLFPLPPLDGGKVLGSILPPRWSHYMSMIEPYSFLILIVLLFTGILNKVMGPMVFFLINAIGNLFSL